MAHPVGVSLWQDELASALPVLSEAQRRVLAQWCFGMEQTGLCATHTVAMFLGLVLGCAWQTVRQRLREWYWDADDKPGLNRREVDVRRCFAPLARWVLAHWSGTRVALAMDATSLGDRLTILTISIVYKGCAVPIAWKILPGNQKHAWNPEWLALLTLLKPGIPDSWQVIVLRDRGLYSRTIYRAFLGQGWHPFMRVNGGGTFHPTGSDRRQRLAAFVPCVRSRWAGSGIAFTDAASRLSCTLLTCWEVGYKDPWCILTDLDPQQCSVAWYGLRTWIEQDFRTRKRGFWHWEHTRMTDPARAERLWLPMARCTFKLRALGDALEQDITLPLWGAATLAGPRRRTTRLVRLGWLALRAAHATSHSLPHHLALSPDPWPDQPPPASLHHPTTKAVACTPTLVRGGKEGWQVIPPKRGVLVVLLMAVLLMMPQVQAARPVGWQPAPHDLIGGFNLGAVVGTDGRIYTLGGFHACDMDTGFGCNGMEAFDVRRRTWQRLANMPMGHFLFSIATSGGKIYVIGGGPGGQLDALVDTYTIATKQWGPATYTVPATASAATAGRDGRIYVMGGGTLSAIGNFAEVYNPRTGRWTGLPPMQFARFSSAATTGIDGRIYVLGGVDGSTGDPMRSVEVYNPVTNRWAFAAPMPTIRDDFAAVTVPNGRIYAIGGTSDWFLGPKGEYGLTALSTVEIYDPRTNHWSKGPSLYTPRYGLAAVLGPDDKIYAIGGSSGNQVETLDVRPADAAPH